MRGIRKQAAFFAITLLVALGALPAAGDAGGHPNAAASAEHDRIVAFWTNARVAQAVPRDFEADPANGRFSLSPRAKGGSPSANRKPGAGSTVVGASWTAGGEVLRTTGKVLFAMDGSYWVCSATVAEDAVATRSIILTAGHCAYDETNHAFATNWMFVPDYDSAPAPLDTAGNFCASTSLGCWTASSLVVAKGFATAGGFNTQATLHDYAFAVVGAGGKTGSQLDTATGGGHPIQFSTVANNTDTYLFGYPAAGKYHGTDLVYSRGPLGTDPYNSNLTYRVVSDMTGGSSGGGWYAPFSGGSGTLMSVNSYGYSGVTAMHGPKLNAETQSMFNTAGSATANTIVG